jgi:predicted adenine nucleotide alpha hydrolase (AANH) superfamily ATPase
MKLLVHTCCAPCSTVFFNELRKEKLAPEFFQTALFWYNPNIHPYTEYRSRRDSLAAFARDEGLKLIMEDEYGLRGFIQAVYSDMEERCCVCYRLRLERSARRAAENAYDAFSTTLLTSPYQQHDLIRRLGEEYASQYGVDFFYRDFRPWFREAQKTAREKGRYMQKYCGCIFSEEERYLGK